MAAICQAPIMYVILENRGKQDWDPMLWYETARTFEGLRLCEGLDDPEEGHGYRDEAGDEAICLIERLAGEAGWKKGYVFSSGDTREVRHATGWDSQILTR